MGTDLAAEVLERGDVGGADLEPGAGDEITAGGQWIDDRDGGSPIPRRDSGGEADRARAEHHHPLVLSHAGARDRVHRDGDRLDQRCPCHAQV